MARRSTTRGPGRPPGGGDSREAILEAAQRLFLSKGLKTSLRDIAVKAGVTPSALYHYYPTKDELIAAAAQRAGRLMRPVGLEVMVEAAGADPRQVFERAAAAYLHIFSTREGTKFVVTIIAEGGRLPEHLASVASQLDESILHPMVTYVERLKAEGRARPEVDARLVAQTLFGSLFAYALARNLLQAPWLADVGPDVVAAHVADMVARGIAPDEVDPQARPVEEVERGHQDAGAHS